MIVLLGFLAVHQSLVFLEKLVLITTGDFSIKAASCLFFFLPFLVAHLCFCEVTVHWKTREWALWLLLWPWLHHCLLVLSILTILKSCLWEWAQWGIDLRHSTVNCTPYPRRLSFLFYHSRDEKPSVQPLWQASVVTRGSRAPLFRSWRYLWWAKTDFEIPGLTRGWLLAQVAILITEGLSFSPDRRVPCASPNSNFPAHKTWENVGLDNSYEEPVHGVNLIKKLHLGYSDQEPICVFCSRHLHWYYTQCLLWMCRSIYFTSAWGHCVAFPTLWLPLFQSQCPLELFPDFCSHTKARMFSFVWIPVFMDI